MKLRIVIMIQGGNEVMKSRGQTTCSKTFFILGRIDVNEHEDILKGGRKEKSRETGRKAGVCVTCSEPRKLRSCGSGRAPKWAAFSLWESAPALSAPGLSPWELSGVFGLTVSAH